MSKLYPEPLTPEGLASLEAYRARLRERFEEWLGTEAPVKLYEKVWAWQHMADTRHFVSVEPTGIKAFTNREIGYVKFRDLPAALEVPMPWRSELRTTRHHFELTYHVVDRARLDQSLRAQLEQRLSRIKAAPMETEEGEGVDNAA